YAPSQLFFSGVPPENLTDPLSLKKRSLIVNIKKPCLVLNIFHETFHIQRQALIRFALQRQRLLIPRISANTQQYILLLCFLPCAQGKNLFPCMRQKLHHGLCPVCKFLQLPIY